MANKRGGSAAHFRKGTRKTSARILRRKKGRK